MKRSWASNKSKISGELINVLARFKYAYTDKATGQLILRLTDLQRRESIQSVAAWFRDKSIADLLLGELRQQLEVNGLPPLRDHADTADDAKRTQGFWEFGRPIK